MEDNMNSYYGVLMNRVTIIPGIYLFRPVCLLEGNIDTSGEDTLFVDTTSNAYYMSTDGNSLKYDGTESIAYVISKEELLARSPKMSIECAMADYYEQIATQAYFGFHIVSDNCVDLIAQDLVSTYQKLNYGDFEQEEDLIVCEVDVDDIEIEKEVLQGIADGLSGEDSLIMPVTELERILNQPSLEKVKDELSKIYSNVKGLQSGNSQNKEQTSSIFDKVNSGKDIMNLFNLAYEEISNKNDINELKEICSNLSDFYMELSLEFDERGEYDDVSACKDYLYVLVDTYDKMLKMDNIDDIKREFKKIKNDMTTNIERVAAIYDVRKPIEYIAVEEEKEEKQDKKDNDVIDINEMEEYLNSKVIGQEEAKIDVIQTIFTNLFIDNPKDKLSCLLVGPTGSGKTLILEEISKYLDKPMQIIDTTQLTMPGYVGANIEDFLTMLITKADGDVKKAEHGIVVFDELDKKGSSNNSDVSGKGVLNTLLPFIDGTTYQVSYKHKQISFDTSNLTIFATGAFTDIVKEKKSRGYHSGGMGFHVPTNTKEKEDIVYEKLEIDDFEEFGLIPIELLGRFSTISQLSGHTKDSLRKILLSEVGVLHSNVNLFNKFNVSLKWTDGFIEAVADKALNLGTGARSLKSTISNSLKQVKQQVFRNPNMYSAVILNENTIKDNSNCELFDYEGNSYNLKDILANKNDEKQYVKRMVRKGE